MRQHRALGDARRAAGVLQERDVLGPERNGRQVLVPALAQRVRETHCARQAPLRHLLAHVAQHEVHDGRLREAEQVADARDDDGVEVDVVADLLQRVREVLEDHQRTRTGVAQLVPQLARRVHRVRVDDRETGTERAQDRDRVLQHVRQHDRDAVARPELRDLLQVGGEARAEHVELAVGQRAVHAREARPVAVPLDAALEQVQQRRVLRRVDLRGYARRVMCEPDLVHDRSPVWTRSLVCRAGVVRPYIAAVGTEYTGGGIRKCADRSATCVAARVRAAARFPPAAAAGRRRSGAVRPPASRPSSSATSSSRKGTCARRCRSASWPNSSWNWRVYEGP